MDANGPPYATFDGQSSIWKVTILTYNGWVKIQGADARMEEDVGGFGIANLLEKLAQVPNSVNALAKSTEYATHTAGTQRAIGLLLVIPENLSRKKRALSHIAAKK